MDSDESIASTSRSANESGIITSTKGRKNIIYDSEDDEDSNKLSENSKSLSLQDNSIVDNSFSENSTSKSSSSIYDKPTIPLTEESFFSQTPRDSIFNSTKIHSNLMKKFTPQKGNSSFTQRQEKNEISDSEEETSNIVVSDEDSDIIEGSLDESKSFNNVVDNFAKKLDETKLGTLDNFVIKKPITVEDESLIEIIDDNINCTREEYNEHLKKLKEFEQEMFKTKSLLSTIKLPNLPDKGELLKNRFEKVKQNFLDAQEKLKKMVVVEENSSKATGKTAIIDNWSNIQAGIQTVQPKTFGKKGLENYNIQKALTAERLEQLHGSLKNCPTDNQLEEDPYGLKLNLMEHQKRALAWLLYREKQKPPGGILADDMGLGKTLTMISLILKTNKNSTDDDDDDDEDEKTSKRHKYKGGTLVICPASLLNQWSGEIDSKLKRGMLSYEIYHGPKREEKPKRLAKHDVVITTYSLVQNEKIKDGPIFRIKWNRIILDEAHQIRNHKAATSIACCELSAKHRWALTGTPVHNKEMDMYALLKFLQCSPFDDLTVWKRWVGDKTSGGGERLHAVISSLMLRRTKAELMELGKLNSLPSRKWELLTINLDKTEMSLYQKILIFSQTLFHQFLCQREGLLDWEGKKGNPSDNRNFEYFKLHKKLLKMNKMQKVSQHEILVLLLRLRQCCCHPHLITNFLQGEDLGDENNDEEEDLNLLDQLNKLNIDDDDLSGIEEKDAVTFKEAAKNILNPSHPIFNKERMSSKIEFIMKIIPNILTTGDKIIMVSQWKSYLELIGIHLKENRIKFLQFDGSVPTNKRSEMVSSFNDPDSKYKVLLLSLTAGGVGLNLIGGNHLFLLDLHWNPQLELQAQDRIYRMGQNKDVHVYKFMAIDTIEERIKKLQDDKLSIAESMLTGSKHVVGSKLSLQDLKTLFQM